MSLQFNHVSRDGDANITVVVDGEMYVADDEHPLFNDIVAAAVAGDEGVVNLFDASRKAAAVFENITDRVTVSNSRVYVDQTEVEDVYAEQIIRFMNEGLEDYKPLALFLEKVYSNVNAEIREGLSRWLQAEKFTILPNGNILGYRGLNSDYTSKHAGPGVVNGVTVNGHLDNSVGNVVEIDAKLVEHTPTIGCASGLHVGTYEYAQSWASGGALVEVEVDPRHIRSVPFDSKDAKMRVTRYVVRKDAEGKVESAVADASSSVYEDDDYCFDCGEYDSDCYCDY